MPGFTELEPLGEGTFGRVVLARQDVTGHLVAIKYLFPWFVTDTTQLGAFRQEAAALHRVADPHVARLYEFFETPQGAAIVMEAVPGVSLRAILEADGVLDPEAALALLKGSLLGLAAAHTAGVVHRDYKPDNVLVTGDRQSKLVDFGTAVLAGDTGLPVGTPAYMAPEQWAGGPATPATDVYAATCVFFQCVTGHKPYQAQETEVLRNLHEYAPIPFGEAPEPVRELVNLGMAKRATERPASAAVFLGELERFAVAGYGEDWEERGRTRLAQRAAALVAITPLAMLAGATAALAPGGAAVAAGSGTAIATGAGGGVLVKAGAIAAGIAAVATGAVIVVSGGDEPPPPVVAAAPLRASVVTTTDRAPGSTVPVNAQLVQVTGGADPALTERINQQLRAPVDAWTRYISDAVPGWGPNTRNPGVRNNASVRTHTDSLLVVRYEHRTEGAPHATWDMKVTTLNIDLRTGRQLGPKDVFADSVVTDDGVTRLMREIWDPRDCPETAGVTYQAANLDNPDPQERPIEFALAPGGVEFDLEMPALGGSTACGARTKTLAYTEAAGLLRPEIMALVPKDGPAPTSRPDGGPRQGVAASRLVIESGGRFTVRPQGLEDVVVDLPSRSCPDPRRYANCAYFMVTDNTKESAEQPRYEPGKPYRRSANGRACNAAGRKDLWQDGDAVLLEERPSTVAGEQATYQRWEIQCVPKGTRGGAGEVKVTQQVWYVPGREEVVLDEWNTPGLEQLLANATWR
ncbi:serine/threonine protein kinase [Amycolatopsis suaedae]|uniref:non-specific serine/threonine protein kinase n=1 Tax=Amycolatopsis suaedae TaxID=2510978 RepID=A0A4Q7JFP8_9PSEU|nr:serine/threonine protein kinase [Amycolatopsis suaedae]